MKRYMQIHQRQKRGDIQDKHISAITKNLHVAVIPDGNRRWAREHGLRPWKGHYEGAKLADQLIEWCIVKYNIPMLTLYSLSSENLTKRPKTEIKHLNKIYEKQFLRLADDDRIHDNKVRINVLGDIQKLSKKVRKATDYAIDKTKTYKKHTVNFLMPYSGRSEIVMAAKNIAKDIKRNKLKINKVTEKKFQEYLFTNGMPEPDVVIRTGEKRMSDFLLWQTAYSEVYFIGKYWPYFNLGDLKLILLDFSNTKRNFGK